ncbi:hypothetical protein KJ765_06300 [Candidatus Micrarchaeota archaeon]|nr:hypothetical protein [Candidatus Micrarchaeota archaeon]
MNLARLIALVVKHSKLTDEEVLHNIQTKQKEYQNLISEESAAELLLQDLGVSVKEEDAPVEWNTLEQVAKSQPSEAHVVARLLQIYSPKRFETSSRKGIVCNIEIADESGKGTLVLWNEDVRVMERQKWKRNDVWEMKRLQPRNFNPLEVHASMLTEFSRVGERQHIEKKEARTTPFEFLREGTEVDVLARVVEIGALKEFDKSGRTGKVVNITLLDDKGKTVPAVLWDYYAEYASQFLNIGDAILLEGFPVKNGRNGLELNASWKSHLVREPFGHKLKAREAVLSQQAPSVTLTELARVPRGVITAELERIISFREKGDSIELEAEFKQDEQKVAIVFRGNEALQLLGLRHVPTIPLETILKLKEAYLKGKTRTVVIQKEMMADRVKLLAEHVMRAN